MMAPSSNHASSSSSAPRPHPQPQPQPHPQPPEEQGTTSLRIPDELNTEMRRLVERFGAMACHNALSSFTTWSNDMLALPPIFPPDYEVMIDDSEYEHQTLQDLARLRKMEWRGELSSFRLQAVATRAIQESILHTFDYYRGLADEDGELRRWKELSIESVDEEVIQLLSDAHDHDTGSLRLFRCIEIDLSESETIINVEDDDDQEFFPVVPAALMTAIFNLVSNGEGSLEEFYLGSCSLSVEDTHILRQIVESNRLKRLHFMESVSFLDDDAALLDLSQAFASCPSALEGLTFHFDQEWDVAHIEFVFTAIRNVATTLQDLHICGAMRLPKVARTITNMLRKKDCSIVKLTFQWQAEDDDDDDDDDDTSDEEDTEEARRIAKVEFKAFLAALKTNKSIRTLDISSSSLGEEDCKTLFEFITSIECSIENFSLFNLRLENLEDLISMDRLQAISPENSYKYRVRRLDLRNNPIVTLANISILTEMVKRLPYLYDVGLHVELLVVESYSKLQEELDSLRVNLERNQVGRALLHPGLTSSVPISLWPVVLARAVDTESVFLGDGPPLDGIYYMVRELLAGGFLNNSSSQGGISSTANNGSTDEDMMIIDKQDQSNLKRTRPS